LREFVTARLAEADAYADYRDQFRPPRLGPADVRTLAELDRLDGELHSVLLPPEEYVSTWAETNAVKMHDKWAADVTALRSAEARLHDWYRGLVRRANGLLLADPFDPAWKTDGDALLRDVAVPPAKPTDPLPGSPGEPLTYAVPLDFTQVDFDKRDWEAVRDRLSTLRSAVAAVSPGGPLDLPEPTGDAGVSLALGSDRLKSLPKASDDWVADRFPDPARTELQKRYRRAFDAGVRHVRAVVRSKLPTGQDDAPADWAAVAEFAKTDAGFQDWTALLDRLARLAGDKPPVPLVPFLTRTAFELTLTGLEVAVPVDLTSQRIDPGEVFSLKCGSTEYKMKRIGEPARRDGEIVARYVPDGWAGKLTLAPGDRLTASLPVSADGPEVRLVWDSNRTHSFAFESLSRAPALVPATGPRSPAAGVHLTVTPPTGLPAVPVVLPDLSIPSK
jgi:hypothetical protein